LDDSWHRQAEVAALLEGAKAVLEYQEFEQAARAIFDVCKPLIGAASGYVALLNDDGSENEVLFLDAGGLPCTVDPELPMPIRGLRSEAYHTGQVVHDNDFEASEWTQFIPEGHVRLENVLFAPLTIEGEVVGLIGLANKPGGFTPDDRRIAAAFGDFVAVALLNSRTLEFLTHTQEMLRKNARELRRSNAELHQFAQTVSHDLKEPLRMVTSYLNLLERRYKDQLDETADEYIHFAVDGAERMSTLINDLLDYARISTRDQVFRPVDGADVLGRVLHYLQFEIEAAGATITHDELPVVRGDETQLVQLFQNLLGNALKFRGEEPPRVHISVAPEGEMWRFAVRDNGIGIAPEHHQHIFGVFRRLHSREAYEGTGIGLATCQKIVERHGGRIWVESALGRGATFFFTLPMG
jgi:signal transduction histidine kinase